MSANIDIRTIVKENRTVVLILSAALVMAVAGIAAFAPLANQIRLKHQECVTCETQVADARNIIEVGRRIDKEYGGRILISEQDAAIGLEEFTRYGKSLGTTFLSIKPQDIILKKNAQYKILPIKLSFEAGGEEFVKFMTSIDELKKAIVTVNNFDITPEEKDKGKLKINMVIDIYLSLEENKIGTATIFP